MTKIIDLMSHQFEERTVRTSFTDQHEPLFVAKDVCEALEIVWNGSGSLGFLDEDESLTMGVTDTLGRTQQTILLTESGLYATVFQSRKPEARKFRKWVTSVVLPALRKTGRYANADAGYTITTTGEARVTQLRALAQCERYITLYTARRDAILRGEPLALGGGLAAIAVEGAVPILPHLRALHPALPIERLRGFVQLAIERLTRKGLPVGRMLHEGKWLRTARPEDLAAVLTIADFAGKGGV